MSDEVDASVAQALAGGDPRLLGQALREHPVAILITEGGGERVPAVLVDGRGVRCLAAFTSQAALTSWGPAVVEMVPGSELPDLAHGQGVDEVLFDPSGPVPVRFDPASLRAIVDGVIGSSDGTTLVGDLEVLSADSAEGAELRTRLAADQADHLTGEVYLVDRLVGRHFVPTVAFFGADPEFEQLRDLVQQRAAGLGVIDVLRLDEPARRAIVSSLPSARVNPDSVSQGESTAP